MEQIVIAKNPARYGWGKKRLRITGRRTYDLVLKQRNQNDKLTLVSCGMSVDDKGVEYLVMSIEGVPEDSPFIWTVNGIKIDCTSNSIPIYYSYKTLEITCTVENEDYLMILTGKASECDSFSYNLHAALVCGGQICRGNKLVSNVPLPSGRGSE